MEKDTEYKPEELNLEEPYFKEEKNEVYLRTRMDNFNIFFKIFWTVIIIALISLLIYFSSNGTIHWQDLRPIININIPERNNTIQVNNYYNNTIDPPNNDIHPVINAYITNNINSTNSTQ